MSDTVISPADRLIVALDVANSAAAAVFVNLLRGDALRFKVGLELFLGEGPQIVQAVKAGGGRVFLDLKLHDIPETVRRAAKQAAATGAELMTVHAAGGRAMLTAAVEGARAGSKATPARVLAVTVLTSLDAADLAEVGTLTDTVEALVVRRALLARAAGCDGVVCSPREARAVRAAVGAGFLIVTPGVRPTAGAALGPVGSPLVTADDQKRVATAREAIEAGADAVVVGRPVRDAADPRAAAQAIIEEMMAL